MVSCGTGRGCSVVELGQGFFLVLPLHVVFLSLFVDKLERENTSTFSAFATLQERVIAGRLIGWFLRGSFSLQDVGWFDRSLGQVKPLLGKLLLGG